MKELLSNLFVAKVASSVLERANEFVVGHSDQILLGMAAVVLLALLVFHRWVWRELSALQTAQIFMILVGALVGASFILPQDGNYEGLAEIARWNWVTNLTKGLRLMNVYTAVPFYVLVVLLFLCAVVCFLHHLRAMFRRCVPERQEVVGQPQSVSFHLTTPFSAEGLGKIYTVLRDGGFRMPKMKDEPPTSAVVETGSGTLWPALLFHLGMILFAVGWLITFLFGFSGHVKVYTDQPAAIPLTSHETQWHALRAKVCRKWDQYFGKKESAAPSAVSAPPKVTPSPSKEQPVLWLGLKKLRIVYEQRPHLNYPLFYGGTPYTYRPRFLLERFKWAWISGPHGLQSQAPREPIVPTDFSAHLVSYLAEAEVLNHYLKPGRSILTEGLNLSLVGCSFKVDLEVENAPPLKELTFGRTFRIPESTTEYYVQNVTAGVQVTLDGQTVELTPTVSILPVPSSLPTGLAPATPSLIVLPLNSPRQVGGRKVRVINIVQGCGVHYRYDPGRFLWGPAAILLLLAICVRVYWSHYRVKLFAEATSQGTTLLHVVADAHGVFSDPQRAIYWTRRALKDAGLIAVK